MTTLDLAYTGIGSSKSDNSNYSKTITNTISSTFTSGKDFGRKSDKYVAKSFVDSSVSISDFDNMSELAAIILSRAQLRKGQPELALELLMKHCLQYGECDAIAQEITKVKNTLGKS